jgi:hypothetical protein
MRNPYVSSKLKTGSKLSGKNVDNTLLPSKGGNGSKLNTASETFRNIR